MNSHHPAQPERPRAQTLVRALLSVSDKTHLVEFAKTLHALNIELVSTGGTAAELERAGIPTRSVSDVTEFPEIMGGRVKTLHPRIHGGLLGRSGVDETIMAEHGIPRVDLVIVNLYPFARVIARPDVNPDEAIENIDIGGPAMLRAAAKNHARVIVVVDPADYAWVAERISAGGLNHEERRALAAKAFRLTADYDRIIADYLAGTPADAAKPAGLPQHITVQGNRLIEMRYGENPHQKAAFYAVAGREHGIAHATQLQGKALSYNNIADSDAALECVRGFTRPACVIVKHANPCGVAESERLLWSYERAYQTDPTSAFGGIIACNRPVDADTAQAIVSRQFVEVIIAPAFDDGARAVLADKSNVRLLEAAAAARPHQGLSEEALELRSVGGGLLVQTRDLLTLDESRLSCVTGREPTAAEAQDLRFAWRVCHFVKSNAIVYVRDGQTMGIGAGQMSRVFSAQIAALKAREEGLDLTGSVLASDAFFPFRDGVDAAAEAGVRAIIQPGGSKRDDEVIAAANANGMAMVFTGIRHFRH